MLLRNKNVLIISPQPWNNMSLSKHHYANELVKRGNDVLYLNPPSISTSRKLISKPTTTKVSNHITTIDYTHSKLLYLLRFKFRLLYNLLIKRFQKSLSSSINQTFDVVWSFEPNIYSDLKLFKGDKTIFHPVDLLSQRFQVTLGRNVDLILSVAVEILDDFQAYDDVPKHHIHHGVSDDFLMQLKPISESSTYTDQLKCGYSGNLIRTDIDFSILQSLIETHQNISFNFYGNYKFAPDAEGEIDPLPVRFVEFLKNQPNVTLHGLKTPEELAHGLQEMDVLLICYDPKNDSCKGTNYHKVMEYLAVGKIVVSNHVTTYKDLNCMNMCSSRTSNNDYVNVFDSTIKNITQQNSKANMEKRRSFAMKNTYSNHVDMIESLLI